MIAGMNNGNIIRIILPAKVWKSVIQELDQFDDYLKNGLLNFLCAKNRRIDENSNPVFFEKILNNETQKSDLTYGIILQKFIEEIIRNIFPEVKSEEYEVTLPYSMTGFYTWHNFQYISPETESYFNKISDISIKDTIEKDNFTDKVLSQEDVNILLSGLSGGLCNGEQ